MLKRKQSLIGLQYQPPFKKTKIEESKINNDSSTSNIKVIQNDKQGIVSLQYEGDKVDINLSPLYIKQLKEEQHIHYILAKCYLLTSFRTKHMNEDTWTKFVHSFRKLYPSYFTNAKKAITWKKWIVGYTTPSRFCKKQKRQPNIVYKDAVEFFGKEHQKYTYFMLIDGVNEKINTYLQPGNNVKTKNSKTLEVDNDLVKITSGLEIDETLQKKTETESILSNHTYQNLQDNERFQMSSTLQNDYSKQYIKNTNVNPDYSTQSIDIKGNNVNQVNNLNELSQKQIIAIIPAVIEQTLKTILPHITSIKHD